MIFLDTETCGLSGIIVTIQTKKLDESPVFYEIWRRPASLTIELIEQICNEEVVAYNLTFDWFHLVKFYNIFVQIRDKSIPPDPAEVWSIEQEKNIKYACRPQAALDLMLHAKQGPLQSLMIPKTEVVKISRVPAPAAGDLKKILDTIPYQGIDWIYFYHNKNFQGWTIDYNKDKDFPDLVLRFAPTLALKPLVKYLGIDENTINYPLPKELFIPDEPEWNPYHGEWYRYLGSNIKFWSTNERAKQYAINDVVYLEKLWNYFKEPNCGDTDSELSIAVANARARGFAINIDKIESLIERLRQGSFAAPKSPAEAKQFIVGDNIYAKLRLPNTKDKTLVAFIRADPDDPAAKRAEAVRKARRAEKHLDICKKLTATGRFYPDFAIIGTKTSRMAGRGGLNAQGIPHLSEFRSLFTFADKPDVFSGGDFKSFEITIADAAYNDSKLHTQLLEGYSFHLIFGSYLYDKSYSEMEIIKETDEDTYTRIKSSVFALLYGAQAHKLAQTAYIEEEKAEQAYKQFIKTYPQVGESRANIFKQFCSVQQPAGLGTQVVWHEPAEYIESLLGFRRYYTLENKVLKQLYNIATASSFLQEYSTQECIRRDRKQTVQNACRSAIYGAIFQLQAANMRSAANHVIQSTGAQLCKLLQLMLWNYQPKGIHEFRVQVMNVHDEVLVVHKSDIEPDIQGFLVKHRQTVPLLDINWKTNLNNWSEVK